MNDVAMTFEYLIRRCHQVGRGAKGADVDEFRSFETAQFDLIEARNAANLKQINKAEKTYEKTRQKIVGFLIKALEKGIKKHGTKLSEEERIKFQAFLTDLPKADKRLIEEILSEANNILLKDKSFFSWDLCNTNWLK